MARPKHSNQTVVFGVHILSRPTLGIRAPPRGMGMFLYTKKERNPAYGVITYYPVSKSRETEHGGSETWAGREQGGGCDGAWVEPHPDAHGEGKDSAHRKF